MIGAWRLTLAALGALLAVSCGDSSAISSGVDEPAPDERAAEAPQQLAELAGGPQILEATDAEGAVTFEADAPARGILLHITARQRYALEWSYQGADGQWSEYAPVQLDEPEHVWSSAQLFPEQPATAVRVRATEGLEALEYLAARFFTEVPAEGVLATHLDEPGYHELDIRAPEGLTLHQLLSHPGRWIPPADVVAAGRDQYVSYEGAPRWNSSLCGGSLLSGTRALSEYLQERFPQISHVGGYSCRPNTANTSQMSVHGTGRALDIHIPLSRGDADNDLGDPIAHWLIENAETIGITLVIWDRTSWGPHRSGDKHRSYGAHPHHDHLHVEISSAAARQSTPFFQDPSDVTDPDGGSGSDPLGPGADHDVGNEGVTCRSSTLGRRVPADECVQMSYYQYGSTCNWARCSENGHWTRQADPSGCPSTAHSNPSCAGVNQPDETDPTPSQGASCRSQTLGRTVPHGTCVQVNYHGRTCARCGWYSCEDGAWMCTDSSDCAGEEHPHVDCGGGEARQELELDLVWTEDVDLDLFVREPGGEVLSYRNSGPSAQDGVLDNDRSCRRNDCSNMTRPFIERVTWGERSGRVATGSYTFWVENYSGTSEAAFSVTARHTEGGVVIFEQEFPLVLPAQEDATTDELSFEISAGGSGDGGGGDGGDSNSDPGGGDPNAPRGDYAGEFEITYYYKSVETDFSGSDDTTLYDASCQPIAQVPASFSDSACIEGSARLEDGRVVNYATTCSCGRPCPTGGTICYEVVDSSRFPWGKGNRNNPLVPLRSLAVDTDIISNGELIYIEDFDGLAIPEVDGLGGFTHDGCFRADDVGGAINGQHFDVFAATSGMHQALERELPTRTRVRSWVRADQRCAHLN